MPGTYYYNADIAGTTVRNISLATPVKVTDGNSVSGINIQLSQGYSISGSFTFTKLDSLEGYRLYFRVLGLSGFSREYAGSKVGDYYKGTDSWDNALEFQTQSVVHFGFSEGVWGRM